MAAAPTALSHRRAAPAALSRRPIPVAIPWVSAAETTSAGAAIAQTNSGSNTGGIVAVTTGIGSTITQTNSGGNDLIDASTTGANSNIVVNNSGSTSTVLLTTTGPGSTETLINSGIVSSLVPGGAAIELFGGPATLTNIVGGRVIGSILLGGSSNTVNFAGGNWLFTIVAGSAPTSNANGAPFVVGPFNPATGNTQVAVLDATTFALADRALMNFTGEVQQTLQGRFDGMNFGAGGGGGAALGFAGQPSSTPGVADQAAQAFSGIPAVGDVVRVGCARHAGQGAGGAVYDRLGKRLWRRA